tara:strand:- start:7765 stop:8148 length:384 start_codon:yes stop_codon:yes gene_type:complete
MTDYYKDKRQLTDEQIAELAPDWATHFSYLCGGIVFENIENYQIYAEGVFYGRKQKSENSDKTPREVKPIPRKKFDISEYDFTDKSVYYDRGAESLYLGSDDSEILLIKQDVIALAKHFNLTAEDLK